MVRKVGSEEHRADPRPIAGHPDVPGVSPPDAADSPHHVEPMTFSLLGRLFGVPLLIIGGIVGCAVTVVLLFGGPASAQQRSIEELLQALESSSGERSIGLLLTREKELWQMALELSLRLEHKDRETGLAETDLRTIATRMGAIVTADLATVDRVPASENEGVMQRNVRSRRLEFAIRALGRTEQPEAIAVLLDVLASRREPFVTVALRELGELHHLSQANQAVTPIVSLMTDSAGPETLLVGATVLSVLASPEDRQVIDALARLRLSHDGEVAWSAALALARLRSAAGKSTLMDLLDRSYLESEDRYATVTPGGGVARYPLPRDRVDAILIAAMDASAHLGDPQLWDTIGQLQQDPSPKVRGHAMALIKSRGG